MYPPLAKGGWGDLQMNKKTVAIIGAGRVGSAVGALLAKAGYVIRAVTARTKGSAEGAQAFIGAQEAATDPVGAATGAGIVFITTPDRAIRDVSEKLAAGKALVAGTVVVHMSGAHSLDLLDAAATAGAFRAVLHPLQSLASREQGVANLPGSYFRIEADAGALETARELVKALGGIELKMPGWTSDAHSAMLYHAGAVAVSNYFVALVDYGLKFYEKLGADRSEALTAVLPLIRGTLRNIEAVGIPDALTGPIARGDASTVRDHIAAMEARAPELLDLYRQLAAQTVAVAQQRGSLSEESVRELLLVIKK